MKKNKMNKIWGDRSRLEVGKKHKCKRHKAEIKKLKSVR